MKVSTPKLRNLSTAMDWQVHTLDTLTHNSFFLTYRTDTTRLEFAIPLRESFALPFIAAQILFTTIYLRQFKFIGKLTQVIQLYFLVWITCHENLSCTCGIPFLTDNRSRVCVHKQSVCGPNMAVCTVCVSAGRSCTLCSTSAGDCPNIKGIV